MEAIIFLLILALLWSFFASIHDLRTREVPNWLSYSLVIFALGYRLFYSISQHQWNFFLVGLLGAGICFVLSLGFYYGRVFAGGDAKLLIGFGALLPVASWGNMIIYLFCFFFLLFFSGSIYSLVYSVFLVVREKRAFAREFKKNVKDRVWSIIGGAGLGAIFLVWFYFTAYAWLAFGFFVGLGWLYCYLRALEKSCFIKKKNPSELAEGDWLARDVILGKKWIRSSVHGLSYKEIELLRKAKKSVYIKEGVPFVPAFFLALVLMVYAGVILGSDWVSALVSLF